MNERLQEETRIMNKSIACIKASVIDLNREVHTLSFLEPMSISKWAELNAAVQLLQEVIEKL